VQNHTIVYQPPTPERGAQLTLGQNSTFFEQKVRFSLIKNVLPFQAAGSIGSNISSIGSPARGVIWVENNDPDVFQSPVGTECGYFSPQNTHIPSLTGLRKHRESPFATHISPLTGLLAMLKPEPIDPSWKGSPAYVRSIFYLLVDTGLYTLSASE
jgi:hypothetical protein